MNFPRLPAVFRLLLRAVLGFGATAAAVLGYSALLSLAVQAGQPLAGTWQGTAQRDDLMRPLQLELRGRGGQVQGALFDGRERLHSTSGQVDGDTVTLEFARQSTRLVAKLDHGRLRGRFDSASLGQYELELRPVRGAPVGGVLAAAQIPVP